MKETTKLLLMMGVFAGLYFLPVESEGFRGALHEAFYLARWYAREHVLLCLVPAFFIAGAIGLFVSQGAVLEYLGPKAKKWVAYPVAAVSGGVLAVCSCTVLPLVAGIYKRGAGIGPASTFLYSGPAINVLAVVMTAQVLGVELGVARAIGAVLFSVVIGLLMHLLFGQKEAQIAAPVAMPTDERLRKTYQNAVFFVALLGILVFANWLAPADDNGLFSSVHTVKWWLTAGFGMMLVLSIIAWFKKDELIEWTDTSWSFAKQILPPLVIGVFVAGFLLGSPGGGRGLIPPEWVQAMVGGNSLGANLFASVAGALMYFATLTEVPILDGLIKAGMGKGPALALLLAGPALSLPNMLVIRGVLGNKKTVAYILLVVIFSTLAGMVYGALG